MKRRMTIFSLILNLLLNSGIHVIAQTRPDIEGFLSQSKTDLINKYVTSFPENTQLSLAFITDSDVNFSGLLKVNGKLLPIDNKDSVFEIGSITKLFTSDLLATLVKENVLHLNDPVQNDLPYKLKQTVKDRNLITYKTLANHTSGLPRMPDNYATGYNSVLLREYLEKQLILLSVPGEKYQYSNLGAGLLGFLLEIKTGKHFEELLQNLVCSKYNMHFTTIELKKVKDLTVQGRDSLGNIIPNWHSDILKAAGGILSNATDLSKFVLANFTNDSILSYQREITYISDGMDLALGWHIIKFGGNKCRWYFHNGGMDGYRSCLFMDLNTKSAVIILSNLSASHPESENIDKLCHELLKQLFIERTKNDQSDELAPFLEMALLKGWGTNRNDSIKACSGKGNSIAGVWQKKIPGRTITRTFMTDGKVQSDFSGDPEIDIWGYYSLKGDEIEFRDTGGAACNHSGLYRYSISDGKLTFTLLKDSCDGRSSGLSGIWTRQ